MRELSVEMVILLTRWMEASSARRQVEQMCGYPEEYGGDAELLEETRDILVYLSAKMKESGI